MIRINELRLPLDSDEKELVALAAKALRCPRSKIVSLQIQKKAVDSRKKENVHFVFNVNVTLDGDEDAILAAARNPKAEKTEGYTYEAPALNRKSQLRPVVVGFGPAGPELTFSRPRRT